MEIAAIILAAGQGTASSQRYQNRFIELAVGLCWHESLDAAIAANASHPKRIAAPIEQIQDWLNGRDLHQDKPLGTGHAVQAAASTLADFDGVALVMFADTPLVTPIH